jgi:hypothetical protein
MQKKIKNKETNTMKKKIKNPFKKATQPKIVEFTLTDEQSKKMQTVDAQLMAQCAEIGNLELGYLRKKQALVTKANNLQLDLQKELNYILRDKKVEGRFIDADYKNNKVKVQIG